MAEKIAVETFHTRDDDVSPVLDDIISPQQATLRAFNGDNGGDTDHHRARGEATTFTGKPGDFKV